MLGLGLIWGCETSYCFVWVQTKPLGKFQSYKGTAIFLGIQVSKKGALRGPLGCGITECLARQEQSVTMIGQPGSKSNSYWPDGNWACQLLDCKDKCSSDWPVWNRVWIWLGRQEQSLIVIGEGGTESDPELIRSHSSAVTASLHVGELTAVTQSADNISSLCQLLHYVTVVSLLLPFFNKISRWMMLYKQRNESLHGC